MFTYHDELPIVWEMGIEKCKLNLDQKLSRNDVITKNRGSAASLFTGFLLFL
jgi:hypothetical protein